MQRRPRRWPVATARDFVQRTESEPAARETGVDLRGAEGEYSPSERGRSFEARDAFAKFSNGG